MSALLGLGQRSRREVGHQDLPLRELHQDAPNGSRVGPKQIERLDRLRTARHDLDIEDALGRVGQVGGVARSTPVRAESRWPSANRSTPSFSRVICFTSSGIVLLVELLAHAGLERTRVHAHGLTSLP